MGEQQALLATSPLGIYFPDGEMQCDFCIHPIYIYKEGKAIFAFKKMRKLKTTK